MDNLDRFQPLSHIRVVEFSHMIFGPACGMFLGLLGAEVIKVEPPTGDKTRQLKGMGASFFPTFNRGKKSLCVDQNTPEGKEVIERLLASADILVENFRDHSLERMGLDPDKLKEKYPQLITVSCKGFLDGPYRERSALDEVVQMMTGLAYMTGPPGNPLRIGSSANDIMGGLFGAFTALAALQERGATGKGRNVRVGLFENSLLLVAQHMVQYALLGVVPEPMPNRSFTWPVYDIFSTSDQKDIFIGAVTDGQWESLCRLLHLEHLLDDPRLTTRMDQIHARNWTIPLFSKTIQRYSFIELATILEPEGIPFAPVAKPSEMYDHPQSKGRLPVSELPDGDLISIPGMPIEVDHNRVGDDHTIPALGSYNDELLKELGLS